MKINSIDVNTYGSARMMILLDDSTVINFSLSPDDTERLKALGLELFLARQQALAKEIADARPAQLMDLRTVEDDNDVLY